MRAIPPPISPPIRVHDLEQAAVLYASGLEPLGGEWQGERLFLLFEDSAEARDALAKLATGTLRLDPSIVIAGFRKARKRLWEEKARAGTLR